MSYNIFHNYGLDKIHDSLTEDYDYKDNDPSVWKLVKKKEVTDQDGFLTDYAWYTNGDKHIFMFGDTDLYEPDEDYADWDTESEQEASDWFDNYNGFSDEDDWGSFEEDEFDNTPVGNYDFMNEGFNKAYNIEVDLES